MSSLTEEQVRERVLFVGDRTAFGISLGFGIIILIFFLFNVFQISFINFPFLYWLFILIAIVSFLCYVAINEEFYYSFSVINNPDFILVQIIWVSFTVFVAGCLEPFGWDWSHIIDVTFIYFIMYITSIYIVAYIMKINNITDILKKPTISNN